MHVLRSDAADRLVNGVHGRTSSHQAVGCFLFVARFRDERRHAHQPRDFEGVMRFPRDVRSSGLSTYSKCRGTWLDGRGRRSRTGNENDGNPGIDLMEPAESFNPDMSGRPTSRTTTSGRSLEKTASPSLAECAESKRMGVSRNTVLIKWWMSASSSIRSRVGTACAGACRFLKKNQRGASGFCAAMPNGRPLVRMRLFMQTFMSIPTYLALAAFLA